MGASSVIEATNMKGTVWLTIYITTSLGVTLLNKALFSTYNWPYPTSLALLHYTFTSVGSLFIVRFARFVEPAVLDWGTHFKIFLFSVLFNVNIWMSNYTLNLVSMAMHQVIRALIPACTVALSFFLLGKTYNTKILGSLVVIFLGVVVYAAKGEVNYSVYGLVFTFMGAVLAALKGVLTNMFMVGSLKLHPLDLIVYTSTYSGIQLFCVLLYTGELEQSFLSLLTQAEPETSALRNLLIVNGAGAFLLNVASFNANRATSPLAMNIGGITKQILSIVLAIIVFRTPVTKMTAVGVCVTIVGIILYTRESLRSKQKTVPAVKAPTEIKTIN
eukprot:m.339949 g.339949  ORF g.339949 m.339949 type:complete len:331 (-) comp19045_c0_seq1:70-1062(-)